MLDAHLDAHEVAPRLWQGSRPKPDELHGVDLLVLAAEEYQPARCCFPAHLKIVRAAIPDERFTGTEDELALVGNAVDEVVRAHRSGKTVLVTCWAGLNRSGLIVGLALRQLYGLSGAEATKTVRRARPLALFNEFFVQIIETGVLPY